MSAAGRQGSGVMSDSEEEEECPDRQLKFVVLGDGASGKVSRPCPPPPLAPVLLVS